MAASEHLLKSSRSQPFWKIFAKFTGKNLPWALFLVKLKAADQQTYHRRNPSQVYYYEVLEVFLENVVYWTPTGNNFCLPTCRIKFFHIRSLSLRKTWAISFVFVSYNLKTLYLMVDFAFILLFFFCLNFVGLNIHHYLYRSMERKN